MESIEMIRERESFICWIIYWKFFFKRFSFLFLVFELFLGGKVIFDQIAYDERAYEIAYVFVELFKFIKK